MTDQRALVLGGGGIVGIAWETGLIAGLAERGVQLARAEDMLGTSAGSLVGAWLAGGRDFDALAEHQAAPPAGRGNRTPDSDPGTLARVFRVWTSFEKLGPEQARQLGALALAAPTPPEERSVAWFAHELAHASWPERLRVTAVDAESGERVVFDASSGVPLERAVAASCCVPGIFAPVSIDGRRYVDGGVRSGTSADLALASGARHVVVITPMVRGKAGLARLMQDLLDAEVLALREAGAEVALLTPSREDARALGLDFMDPKKREQAVRLGLEAGRREAERAELAAWRS
ncbi:MAG TPA: patatin-like phospholipase family protein [Myxococcota bacterium]|jgi:NTE family protein